MMLVSTARHYLFLGLAAVALLTSCCNNESSKTADPYATLPKKVIVISDTHMGDQRSLNGGWGWLKERRSVLIDFLYGVASKPNEYSALVVAGDMFDEWVAPLDVVPFQNLEGENSRKESDFFQVLVRDNQDVLDAFRAVRAAGIELVYVPGNHDLTCTKEDFDKYLPGLFTQARDAYGLGSYTPVGMNEVVIEHGHRYDATNMPNPVSTPGGYLPMGYAVSKYASTLAYYQQYRDHSLFDDLDANVSSADAKFLYERFLAEHNIHGWLSFEDFCKALRKIKEDIDKIKALAGGRAVSPTESFNHFVSDASWAAVMLAKPPYDLTELLTILMTQVEFPEPYNERYTFYDILPYFRAEPVVFANVWTDANWALLQRTNRLPVSLPFLTATLAGGVDAILDATAPTEYFSNPDSDKRIVVFGHTHKGMIRQHVNTVDAKCLYANTGCWIDDKWGDRNSGVTFQTYVELEKKDNVYTVTLREWGKSSPLAVDYVDVND